MVGRLLAILPPFEINFQLLLGYIMKLAFGSPWRWNYFTPNIRGPGISNLHKNTHLVHIYTLIEWSLGDAFHLPREILVRPVYDSNQGRLDLQSDALPPNVFSQQCKVVSNVENTIGIARFFNNNSLENDKSRLRNW